MFLCIDIPCLVIHSPTDGYLGCLYLLTIANTLLRTCVRLLSSDACDDAGAEVFRPHFTGGKTDAQRSDLPERRCCNVKPYLSSSPPPPYGSVQPVCGAPPASDFC